MNRVFSKREKALLVILALLILVALYYFFVQRPVTETLETADSQIENLKIQGDVLEARAIKMNNMKKEIEQLKASGNAVDIPEYDNLATVITFLNTVLSGKEDYVATFAEPTLGGDNIARRSVQISFTAPSYESAKAAVEALQNCPFLCRVDGVQMAPANNASLTNSKSVATSVTIVFYETL